MKSLTESILGSNEAGLKNMIKSWAKTVIYQDEVDTSNIDVIFDKRGNVEEIKAKNNDHHYHYYNRELSALNSVHLYFNESPWTEVSIPESLNGLFKGAIKRPRATKNYFFVYMDKDCDTSHINSIIDLDNNVNFNMSEFDSRKINSLIKDIKDSKNATFSFDISSINTLDLTQDKLKSNIFTFYNCKIDELIVYDDNMSLSGFVAPGTTIKELVVKRKSGYFKLASSRDFATCKIEKLSVDDGVSINIGAREDIQNIDDFVNRPKCDISFKAIERNTSDIDLWSHKSEIKNRLKQKSDANSRTLPDMFGNPIHLGDIVGCVVTSHAKVDFRKVTNVANKMINVDGKTNVYPGYVFVIDKKLLKDLDKNKTYSGILY